MSIHVGDFEGRFRPGFLQQARKDALMGYSPVLPYHNPSHCISATQHAVDAAVRYKAEFNVPIDTVAVYIAALFHDYDYLGDFEAAGADSKEDHAARRCEEYLAYNDIGDDFIDKVYGIILATEHGAPLRSNEDVAMHVGDLHTISGKFYPFIATSLKIVQEQKLTGEFAKSYDEWRDSETIFLRHLIAPQPVLLHTDGLVAGVDQEFIDNANRNITHLWDLTIEEAQIIADRHQIEFPWAA